MALADNKTKIQALLDGINALPDAGSLTPELQEKTVTPSLNSQVIFPDSGYDGLSKVRVNAMPAAVQATPSISITSGGLITASATQTAGYVAAGTKTMTQQLTTQAAQTITPGTTDKTIASGRYLTGTQTIKGDANLIAANIKKGISIFGVAGALEGGGSGSPFSKAEIFTWTSTADVNTAKINHGLGVVPDGYLIVMKDRLTTNGTRTRSLFYSYLFDKNLYHQDFGLYLVSCNVLYDSGSVWCAADFGTLSAMCTANTITFVNEIESTYNIIPAGVTYQVLVYKY